MFSYCIPINICYIFKHKKTKIHLLLLCIFFFSFFKCIQNIIDKDEYGCICYILYFVFNLYFFSIILIYMHIYKHICIVAYMFEINIVYKFTNTLVNTADECIRDLNSLNMPMRDPR